MIVQQFFLNTFRKQKKRNQGMDCFCREASRYCTGERVDKGSKILDENKDKYVRPNEKTESLLSGLICCPICGKTCLHTVRVDAIQKANQDFIQVSDQESG